MHCSSKNLTGRFSPPLHPFSKVQERSAFEFAAVVIVFISCSLFLTPPSPAYAVPTSTCKTLKVKYPFGIAISFAARGGTRAFISKQLYLKHQMLDIDFDGVVCEIQTLQQTAPTPPVTTTVPVAPSCANGGLPCKLGDKGPGGGIIFYDAGQNFPWGQYLEIAPAKAWPGAKDPVAPFGCIGVTATIEPITDWNFFGEQAGWGSYNTKAIVSKCKPETTGASLASALVYGGKDDWFVPARREAWAMAENRTYIGDLELGVYMTSSESNTQKIYVINISNGDIYEASKDASYRVRPIRYVQCMISCTQWVNKNPGWVPPPSP